MKPLSVILLIPIVYAAAVAETSLADAMVVRHAAPDLLGLVAIVWLLTAGGPRGFLVAGAIGLFGDLIAPGRLGLGMTCFLLVGYTIASLRQRVPGEHLAWQVTIVCAGSTLLALGLALGGRLAGPSATPLGELLLRAPAVGLYTAGVSLPVLMILGWLREPFLARRRKHAEFS
jgi:rod shape-determining protein MreD